jgi:DNA-3-methyladenine glycosylase
MNRSIEPERFQSDDAVTLAPWLLGQILVRTQADGRVSRHLITETEAYNGPADKACHASKGRTPRTEVMFRPGGVWYVYLWYVIDVTIYLS